MKYSITSHINKGREISCDYGGRKNLMTTEEERDIKNYQKEFLNTYYPKHKRITTRIG